MTRLNKTELQIRAKRGTAAEIIETSPVPYQLAGELAYSTDNKQLYLSDGTTFIPIDQHLDNIKTYWGTGKDATIYYDASNLIINPKEVGTGQLSVKGAINSDTLTVTASADNTNVSGVNTIWITTTAGDVVLGGLTGGVAGQVLYIIRKDTTNDLTLEDSEGAGDQDFIMHQGADEIIDGGGVVLVCDGSDWYDCSHAKHV